MPNVKVYNMQGAPVGEMTLSDQVFGLEPHVMGVFNTTGGNVVDYDYIVAFIAKLSERGFYGTRTPGV